MISNKPTSTKSKITLTAPQPHISSSNHPRPSTATTRFITGPNPQPLSLYAYQDDEQINPVSYLASQLKQNPSKQPTNLEDILKVSININRKTIQSSSFNEQKFPILVSLETPETKKRARVPVDLIFVIDQSGSMKGEKIQLVKNTFFYLMNYLDHSDRLSIVTFNKQAQRLFPLRTLTKKNKGFMLNLINGIQAKGETDIGLGMTHAFQILKQRRYVNPVTSIFLLSDGKDGKPKHNVPTIFQQYSTLSDITVNTFGYGRDHDPELMTSIADLKDGDFYFIDEYQMIDEAFVDCLGRSINTVAKNIQINVKPEQSTALQGVEITKGYGSLGTWSINQGVYSTSMVTLMAAKKKDSVLEIKIPINPNDLKDEEKIVKIASVEVTLNDLNNTQINKKAELYITLLNETEEVKDEESDDREVMMNFYRVKGAMLIDEARRLGQAKQNDTAQKLLTDFKEEISHSFLKNEVFIRNMVKDLDQAIAYLAPVVFAQYGSQNLTSNARAQMQQRTDLKMNNSNRLSYQCEMTNEMKARKRDQGISKLFVKQGPASDARMQWRADIIGDIYQHQVLNNMQRQEVEGLINPVGGMQINQVRQDITTNAQRQQMADKQESFRPKSAVNPSRVKNKVLEKK